MAKTLTIKIVRGFEIKKGSKYVLVLPHYLGSDTAVGQALTKLFQDADSEFVGLMVKKPTDIKILEIKQNGKTDR